MKTKTRTVRCAAKGLSQKRALQALYDHPNWNDETMRLASIEPDGPFWVAKITEKLAEFPPPKDEPADKPSDEPAPPLDSPPEDKGESDDDPFGDSDNPDSDDSSDSEDKPKSKKPKGESEKAELGEVLDLLKNIADALGIVGEPSLDGGEDSPVPGPVPPPTPSGPPGADSADLPKQEIVHRTKVKPGEAPPGVTPIGSPAFASTSSLLGRVASFTATEKTNMSIKEAKAELDQLYGDQGYKVKQIREAFTCKTCDCDMNIRESCPKCSSREPQRELRALLSAR